MKQGSLIGVQFGYLLSPIVLTQDFEQAFQAFGDDTTRTTESEVTSIVNKLTVITSLRFRVHFNDMNGVSTVAFRDDGVSVISVDIPASTTGNFNSGTVSVTVAVDSEVNFMIDTTASNVGTFIPTVITAFYESS